MGPKTANDMMAIVNERDRFREALGIIERLCTDEIRARFGNHHSKTEEELAGKSKVYSLLVIPRNIARSALNNEQRQDT